ncbi:MAG TPA: hypothetical protein VI112_18545 [Bacteroidia bacterium]|jgi:hypothetical protein
MKQKFLLLLLLAVLAFSCKKKEEPTAVVSYKVSETSSAQPAYTVTYSADNVTKTQGPITSDSWSSSGYEKHNGDHVTFTLDGGTGTGSFTFSIYVNGVMTVTDHLDNPFGPKTIETDIVL